MSESKKAYELSIDEGKVRVVIKIEDIKVEIRNSIKEFITAQKDDINLFLSFTDLEIKSNRKEGYILEQISSKKSEQDSYSTQKESIWFDVDMSEMSNLLNNPIQFSIQGKYPEHLSYFIKELNYRIEWLQYDQKKESVSTVSVTTRSFTQPRIESNMSYSLEDISTSSELLSRAIKKIDLRTGSSYVKINSEYANLDPVMIIIAEKLGYQLEVLDEDAINDLQRRGRKATHIISLIINY